MTRPASRRNFSTFFLFQDHINWASSYWSFVVFCRKHGRRRRNEDGREGGYLSGYNLKTIEGFTDEY